MHIDWVAKLQTWLQVLAFCLAVATIQYAFVPQRPYAPNVVYSVFIGSVIWAVIDLGRHLLPSSAETGWPRGMTGIALVVVAIAAGYLLGTRMASAFAAWQGWTPQDPAGVPPDHWRGSVLVTVIAGVIASFYFYTQTKGASLKRQAGEALRHANEARLKLLESQLEPHMLFNTLANLRALIGSDPARAQAMLDHIISYLRATLQASRSTTHSLQAEFDRLHDYLELMAVRMGPRLHYSLLLPPELAQHPGPALLLQPLVENSIRHGLEPKVDGGHVLVSARRDGQALVLRVEDTGLGEAGAPSGGQGFGLVQVRERLATLHGAAAAVDFEAVPGTGASATIRIPLQP